MIGDIVYYADLGNKRTIGLDARTGRKVFEHERGSYNPVVSDGETIYLTGYHAMYGLVPLTAAGQAQRARTRSGARRAPAQRPPRLHRKRRARRTAASRGRSGARPRAASSARAGAPPRRGPRTQCLQRAARAAPRAARGGSSAPTGAASKERGVRAPPLVRPPDGDARGRPAAP